LFFRKSVRIASADTRESTVEVLLGLLAELDSATESGDFYDRLCAALCSVTAMERAALLIYESTYRTVVPVGSHGIDPSFLNRIEGTLDETPIARLALEEDRVVEVADDLHGHVPDRYARLADSQTITCTPIAAGGRWLGVIFADRAGDALDLDDAEREAMMKLGRLAALTATVEQSTEQRERERGLAERIDLTRELHERVIQRLFGVCLALGADGDLSGEQRMRCYEELRLVVGDLRRALARPVVEPRRRADDLGQLVGRLIERRPELDVEWEEGAEVPDELEPLAQSVLTEALRNIDRHAEAEKIWVRVASDNGTFSLEIENDGVAGEPRNATQGGGLGLRLATLEALRFEGLVEFGSGSEGRWRVRLVVPIET
jgi:signal transduction histidine kinase